MVLGGNAQGGPLTTTYDGVRPQHNNFSPMRLQGAIILGTGGDNSIGATVSLVSLHLRLLHARSRLAHQDKLTHSLELRHAATILAGLNKIVCLYVDVEQGTFFEGAMVRGWASDMSVEWSME